MSRILITGGNGGLGRELSSRLRSLGQPVRIASRQPRPADLPPNLEWAQSDLETGAGLPSAVAEVDVIIHAASSPSRRAQQVDVAGTRRLLEAARAASVKHFLHISIVGIDRIPFPYYQAKVAAEAEVEQGGVPYTLLRATQFHSLIDGWLLQPLKKFPIAFIPTDFKFQPVDTGEVAEALCALAQGAPVGRAPDMGGPEVLTLGEMARPWLAAQGRRAWPLWFPVPGAVGHGFRHGYNTCPAQRQGQITWAQWVTKKYRGG